MDGADTDATELGAQPAVQREQVGGDLCLQQLALGSRIRLLCGDLGCRDVAGSPSLIELERERLELASKLVALGLRLLQPLLTSSSTSSRSLMRRANVWFSCWSACSCLGSLT